LRRSVSLSGDSERYNEIQWDEYKFRTAFGTCDEDALREKSWRSDDCIEGELSETSGTSDNGTAVGLRGESVLHNRPPVELRNVLFLFPNTVDLTINWQVFDDAISELDTTHSGNQLKQLKRLQIDLDFNDPDPAYEELQAADAKTIIDHLRMPSLESITVDLRLSRDGRQYIDDTKAIRKALSGIESPELQHVTVRMTMAIEESPFPEAWVRPCFGHLHSASRSQANLNVTAYRMPSKVSS
jgi:hypothetical protein